MTETGGQPPVSFPTKDVAVLLFLLRRLTRRGINAACGQCPASGGHGTLLKQVMVNTGGNKRQVPAKRQNRGSRNSTDDGG